jgi:hypothetical protein
MSAASCIVTVLAYSVEAGHFADIGSILLRWRSRRSRRELRPGACMSAPTPTVTGTASLFVSGSGNYVPRDTSHTYGCMLWEPSSGSRSQLPILYDVFCAGQAFCPERGSPQRTHVKIPQPP